VRGTGNDTTWDFVDVEAPPLDSNEKDEDGAVDKETNVV
jgi:hypothetical protein